MSTVIRQRAIVEAGGIISVQSDNLPIGATVEVIILPTVEAETSPLEHPLAGLSQEERITRIRSAIGGEPPDPELNEIFAELDRERHADSKIG